GANALEATGHVAVKIELIPLIHSDARIGMPQYDTVVAAKFDFPVSEKGVHPVATGVPVIERFIAHHQEAAGVIGAGPGELRTTVEAAIVLQAGMNFPAPVCQRSPVFRPVRRISRSGNN